MGGGVLTNFLQPADCAGSFQNLCTDGTATGDLKGAVGVSILGITGNADHVHHHWVTETGDTIFLKDAILTAFPMSDSNRVLADYLDGVDITGEPEPLTARRVQSLPLVQQILIWDR